MANSSKPKGTPGKHRKPGESFNISANKEKMARDSGRLASVRYPGPSYASPSLVGSAKFQRLQKKKR